MSNPHDSLFKQVLGQPRYAAAYLARFLPRDVADALELGALAVLPGTFVDEELRHRHTDLLLAVPRRGRTSRDGPAARVYLLLEHQSTVDRLMARRLHR